MITADLKRLGLQPGQRLLDIGCGSGRHTCEAYRLKGVIAVGADLNIADLKQARERLEFHDRLGEHGGGCWCLSTADVRRLPFPDAYFHAVICSEVMEHIPEHHRAADELVRVLKPGGHLVVSVPRYFPERICWALSREYHQANQGHVRIYRKKALISMIEHTGLDPLPGPPRPQSARPLLVAEMPRGADPHRFDSRQSLPPFSDLGHSAPSPPHTPA